MKTIAVKPILIQKEEEPSLITKSMTSGKLYFSDTLKLAERHKTYEGGIYQHLYLTTNEKVKMGEWGIGHAVGIKHNGVIKGGGFYIFKHDGSSGAKLNALCVGARKIVATTNASLKINKNTKGVFKDLEYSLPTIPTEFLKSYCENPDIEQLILECVEIYDWSLGEEIMLDYPIGYKVNTTPQNEVIIG